MSGDRQRNVPAADSSSANGDRNDQGRSTEGGGNETDDSYQRQMRSRFSCNRDAFLAALTTLPPEVGLGCPNKDRRERGD